jgi:hypothetical protein
MSHRSRSRLLASCLVLASFVATGCGAGADPATGPSSGVGGEDGAGGASVSGSNGAETGTGGDAASTSDTTSVGPGGGGGGSDPVGCLPAQGAGAEGTDSWNDGGDTATVAIDDLASCERTYTLSTTAELRDGEPANPRTVSEESGQPVVRTHHAMFDALYALAVQEVRDNSVDAISNFAFNGGQPLPCPEGGCFETGRLWSYVWTRDTAYSAVLGLSPLDPLRTKNSLLFKLSARRDGSRPEIVQDTGTGGSYPISSDRVVWAMGAWELLKYLDGAERAAFLDVAYEAIANTALRDREVVLDPQDGLYRGEQSFLDWREQTYPAWVRTDPVQIGMSKALGTNIGHYVLLDVAAKLAAEKGDEEASAEWAGLASDLKDAIASRFWLEDEGLFSTFKTTTLDPAATRQFDLLGNAFAVLHDIADAPRASSVVSGYPHLPQAAPVIFPQQKDTPIYHNRSTWPFVTAFWLKAAAKVGNAAAVEHGVRTMMRGAAMNLSNMENFEIATGAPWVDDGAMSGPVVNSQRQLWSVAGYVSMVHDVVFGIEASQEGLRFAPRVTGDLRATLFGGATSIALSRFPYKGKRISVVLHLPPLEEGGAGDGVLVATAVRVDGHDVDGVVASADLEDGSVVDVDLGAGSGDAGSIREIDEADLADYENLFGPKSPVVTATEVVGDRVRITWTPNGEAASDVTFSVYRDGERIADGLSGDTTTFTDPGSGDHATTTHCYTVEAVFELSGNASQHAKPTCWWGAGSARVQTFAASSFTAVGGVLLDTHGRTHWDDWGDEGDTLTVTNVTPTTTGPHFIQVLAGNGAGDFTSGITCAVKAVEVWEGATLVGSGQLVMPHLATWDDWRDSNLVRVELEAGTSYTIVVREDEASGNMSDLEHFTLFGGSGGTGGRFNKVNIAELKLLAMGPGSSF